MKKFMIMVVLATVVWAIPVFAEGPESAINEQTRIATANAAVPILGQLRSRRGIRRRYRRRFVIRRYRRERFRRHVIRYRRRHR